MTRRTVAALGAMLLTVAAAPGPSGEQFVLQVPGFADFLAVDGDSVWTTNKGRVERWSAEGKLAEVAMAKPCGAMTIALGSLWVADCQEKAVVRIDPRAARRLATISTGTGPDGELNVVSGAGAIWAPNQGAGTIARIDPATDKVVATVKVDPGTSYLAFGFGALWAVSGPKNTLQKIDPTTNAVIKRTPLGRMPGFLAAGEGAIWVQEQGDGTLAKIDPASAAVAGRVKVGADLKWGDIDTGAGTVWLRTTADQTFVAIDAKTLAIKARVGRAEGSGALRYTPAGIWTTAHDVQTISRWDVASVQKK